MKDIDFLPQRYRDREVRVRARIWRFGMISCLAGFVVLVATAQVLLRRSVTNQLALVSAQYPAALAATAQCEELRKQMRDEDAFAALYTYLRHPWPVSRLVQDITRTLPETIAIKSLRLETTPAPPAAPLEAPPPDTHPAELDLAKLRAERDHTRLSLYLAGSTADSSTLHGYVRGLAPSAYFTTAKLESVESHASPTGEVETLFELRLEIRPGFGQPGGPTSVREEPAPVLTERDPGTAPESNSLTAKGTP